MPTENVLGRKLQRQCKHQSSHIFFHACQHLNTSHQFVTKGLCRNTICSHQLLFRHPRHSFGPTHLLSRNTNKDSSQAIATSNHLITTSFILGFKSIPFFLEQNSFAWISKLTNHTVASFTFNFFPLLTVNKCSEPIYMGIGRLRL